jgi:hypothetical protein
VILPDCEGCCDIISCNSGSTYHAASIDRCAIRDLLINAISWSLLQVEGELGLASAGSRLDSGAIKGTQADATTNATPASIAVGGSRTNYSEAVNGVLKQRHPAMAAPAGMDDVQLVS